MIKSKIITIMATLALVAVSTPVVHAEVTLDALWSQIAVLRSEIALLADQIQAAKDSGVNPSQKRKFATKESQPLISVRLDSEGPFVEVLPANESSNTQNVELSRVITLKATGGDVLLKRFPLLITAIEKELVTTGAGLVGFPSDQTPPTPYGMIKNIKIKDQNGTTVAVANTVPQSSPFTYGGPMQSQAEVIFGTQTSPLSIVLPQGIAKSFKIVLEIKNFENTNESNNDFDMFDRLQFNIHAPMFANTTKTVLVPLLGISQPIGRSGHYVSGNLAWVMSPEEIAGTGDFATYPIFDVKKDGISYSEVSAGNVVIQANHTFNVAIRGGATDIYIPQSTAYLPGETNTVGAGNSFGYRLLKGGTYANYSNNQALDVSAVMNSSDAEVVSGGGVTFFKVPAQTVKNFTVTVTMKSLGNSIPHQEMLAPYLDKIQFYAQPNIVGQKSTKQLPPVNAQYTGQMHVINTKTP